MSEKTCTVNAKEFQQALAKVLKAAAKRSALPFLEEAHIRFDGRTCTLTCTDLELWCQASIPAQGAVCAFVLTGSRKLLAACRYFSGVLEFNYQEGRPPADRSKKCDLEGRLTLRCGNKELCRQVAAANDFPELPQVDARYSYEVDTAALNRRFDRIKYAASVDESRPCNCYVKFFDDRIGTVDGYRMAVSRDPALHVDAPFFLPPGALKLLPVFGGAPCGLLVGKRHAAFEGGGIRVVTRIPEGDSLDFDKAAPQTCRESHTVGVSEFVDSLRYLNELNPDPERIPIRFDGGELSVGTVQGRCSAALELSSIPQTVCGFKGRYMLEGLKQFQAKGEDTVAIQLTSPAAPIVLTDHAGDLALVLPYRRESGGLTAQDQYKWERKQINESTLCPQGEDPAL